MKNKFKSILTTVAILICLTSGCIDVQFEMNVDEQTINELSSQTQIPSETPVSVATFIPTPTTEILSYNLDLHVLNTEGIPINEVNLEISFASSEENFTQVTNEDGIASWDDLPGNILKIKLSALGYLANEISAEIKPGDNQVITMLERDPYVLRFEDIQESGSHIVFLEDFQDDKIDFIELVGNWRIVEDENEKGNKVLQVDQPGTDPVTFARFGPKTENYTNFTIEYRFRFVDLVDSDFRSFASLRFRESYSLSMNPYEAGIRIVEIDVIQNVFKEMLVQYPFDYLDRKWYDVRLEVNGEQVTIYSGGTMLGRISEIAETPATWYFRVAENANIVQFDDIVVKIPND